MIDIHSFTSESVTEGHPDKICDQISDSILDKFLTNDPESRVACETLASTGMIIISGEITSHAYVDIQDIVRNTLEEIGYVNSEFGISAKGCSVMVSIDEQARHIAQGVDVSENHEQGAGDQGMMFGYACKETPELMPLPITLAHRLTERLAKLRKDNTLPWLCPDGKSQVTVEYDNHTPKKVKNVVIATQHQDLLEQFDSVDSEHKFIEENVIEQVIKPVLDSYSIEYDDNFIVNGTGRFVQGGPQADTGLTGRKIIVDTYGGYARHGGGAFSGKDPTKVDRSASYMSRYIAKNVVKAGLASVCEVQLSYCIGVAEPVSVNVDTFGTSQADENKISKAIREVFKLTPAGIIEELNLLRPIYQKTAAYGHFGRQEEGFSWENTDKVDDLKSAVK